MGSLLSLRPMQQTGIRCPALPPPQTSMQQQQKELQRPPHVALRRRETALRIAVHRKQTKKEQAETKYRGNTVYTCIVQQQTEELSW